MTKSVADHVRRLRNHGSERRYYHEEIGWNSRLDAMQAAVLRVKLKHIDDWNQRRRIVACRYHGLFAAAGLAKTEGNGGQRAIAGRVAEDARRTHTTSITSSWFAPGGGMSCGTS